MPSPSRDYQISFEDFRHLISYPAYQAATRALLAEWFDYKILGCGLAAQVQSSSGESLPLRPLYDLIQSDAEKQHKLYQAASVLMR